MFFIAMHLMNKKQENGDLELPEELPKELIKSTNETDERLKEAFALLNQ